MKIETYADTLRSSVEGIAKVDVKSGSIYEHVLISAEPDRCIVSIVGTCGTRIDTEVDASVIEPGQATTIGKILLATLSKMDTDAPITITNREPSGVVIKQKRAKFSLNGEDPRSFPVLPQHEWKHKFIVDRDTIHCGLKMVAHCLDTSAYGNATRGLCLRNKDGRLELITTDGRRMSIFAINGEFPSIPDTLVDGLSIDAFIWTLNHGGKKTNTAEVYLGKSIMMLQAGRVRCSGILLETAPLPYDSIILTKTKHKFVCRSSDLKSAVRRCATFTSDANNAITLSLRHNLLTVTANPKSGEYAENEIDVSGDTDLDIVISRRFINEYLNCLCADSMVTVEMDTNVDPVHFRSDKEPNLHEIIMPMIL